MYIDIQIAWFKTVFCDIVHSGMYSYEFQSYIHGADVA